MVTEGPGRRQDGNEWSEASFGDDENVLKLDCGDSYNYSVKKRKPTELYING